MPPQAYSAGTAANGLLTADAIRRLTLSLIRAEIQGQVAAGRMPPQAATLLDPALHSDVSGDDLAIDEDGLGFDSLSRLSLILRFNRFFHLCDTGIEDYLLVQRHIGDWCRLIDQHLSLMTGRVRFSFATSGSAGPVKHACHTADTLMDEIAALRAGPLAYLPRGARVLSLVPAHHIYGFLFTCLLPRALGHDVLDLCQSGPTAAFRHARPGDVVVATPLHWRLLHESGQSFAPDVSGISSAGPSDDATWAVRQANGLSRMTEVYGATETGGIGSRSEAGAPFRLLAHLRKAPAGTIARVTDGGALPLQDHLMWDDDGTFCLAGRIDDVVKIGGINVSPTHVAAVLRSCDGVAQTLVRLGTDRLKAFVVPVPGTATPVLEARLRHHARHALPAPARPATLTFGTALPVNAMGKLCDWHADPEGG